MTKTEQWKMDAITDAGKIIGEFAEIICKNIDTFMQTKQMLHGLHAIGAVDHNGSSMDEWIAVAVAHWSRHCPAGNMLTAQFPDCYPMLQVPAKQDLKILLLAARNIDG